MSDENGIQFTRAEHELPAEITSMSLDETVCKYCGISYLIHREVSKLQDQVKKLTTELDLSNLERKNAKHIIEDYERLKVENIQLKENAEKASVELENSKLAYENISSEKSDLLKGRLKISKKPSNLKITPGQSFLMALTPWNRR